MKERLPFYLPSYQNQHPDEPHELHLIHDKPVRLVVVLHSVLNE